MSTLAVSPDLLSQARRLSRARNAYVRLQDVPKVLGLEPDDAAEVLSELQAGGLLDVWEAADAPGGHPTVVLSTLAAELLQLDVADVSRSCKDLRWVRRGEGVDRGPPVDERLVNATDLAAVGDGDPLDLMADPDAVPPGRAAELNDGYRNRAERDEATRGAYRPSHHVPMPIVIRGITPDWGAPRKGGAPCPGCGGRPLGVLECCVFDGCDRSGVDAILPAVRKCERPRPFRPDPGGPGGGTGEPGKVGTVKSDPPRKGRRRGKRAGRNE